ALLGGASLALSAGCGIGGIGGVRVAAPTPTGAIADACGRIVAALPRDLDADLKRRPTRPASPFTRAWGHPAVILRCGVDLAMPVSAGVIEASGRCWGSPDLNA